MAKQTKKLKNDTAEPSAASGKDFLEHETPLTRLHYFDGKFLRADALAREQDYHRARSRLTNLAGGFGVVNGLGVDLRGNELAVSSGLAITADGNFVYATSELTADVAELAGVAKPAPVDGSSEFAECAPAERKATKEGTGLKLYEITVGPIEGLCGNEPVYGKLCETACASSSQHPYWREGVVLRLRPIHRALPASTAVTFSNAHLRSRVASAYFAAEPGRQSSLLSASGLVSDGWCNPASLYGRDEVVIGLLVRDGDANRVLDAWGGRRERMDTQARGYWQGRMAMRPWNVFLAQVLQFQCQLSGALDGRDRRLTPADDCEALQDLLDKTRKQLVLLHRRYSSSANEILKHLGRAPSNETPASAVDDFKASYSELYELSESLSKAELGKGARPKNRMLLNAGFVELPPAGYLPVDPGKHSVEDQLSRVFGEGVRLHYHTVRPDEVAHLLEEAQHLDRISLTRGLDDPKSIEDVEVFVPEGKAQRLDAASPGTWWQVDMDSRALASIDLELEDKATETEPEEANKKVVAKKLQPALAASWPALRGPRLTGLARTEIRAAGGYGITLVVSLTASDVREDIGKAADLKMASTWERAIDVVPRLDVSIYLEGDVDKDPFALALGEEADLKGELRIAGQRLSFTGTLTALFDRDGGNALTERIAHLKLISTTSAGPVGQLEGKISLTFRGDERDGRLVLDDARHDPSSSPNIFEWQDGPRVAAMYVLARNAKLAIASQLVTKMYGGPQNRVVVAPGVFVEEVPAPAAQPAAAAPEPAPAPGAPEAEASAHDSAERIKLVSLFGLSGMPALTSTIGAGALNALTVIAELSKDPAFFARARRRLFPALDAPATQRVSAVLDWVMFRRARTHLCCPDSSSAPVKAAVEAIQVWHIAVASPATLKLLSAALASADPRKLAGYEFQRVGVLRYRDESTEPEESAAQVEAMWRQAQPGSQVALGRYWEQAPARGQSWQNRFRLQDMLEVIKGVTTPPSAPGAITALTNVAPPLSDGSVDGGMLVVTMKSAVKLKPHRVILISDGIFADIRPGLRSDAAKGWAQLVAAVESSDPRIVDVELSFDASGQLDAQELKELLRGEQKVLATNPASFGHQLFYMRLDASAIDATTDPVARHKAVLDIVGKSLRQSQRFDEGIVEVPKADLGNGAQVVSVIAYSFINEGPH